MAEMSFDEVQMGEPELTYWKPATKLQPLIPFLPPNYKARSAPLRGGQPCSPHLHSLLQSQTTPFHQQQPIMPHISNVSHRQTSGFFYPLTDVVHSYIKNQQIRLSRVGCEGEQRRISQYPQVNAESLLSALSTTSEQDSQMMADNMIHEEVTRAAKTLFSKRNRTLLHWLNPDVSKNQLKIDVNAAWDSLPAAEKVFYISQVLGKFAPHTTSLMVNPQLEPSKKQNTSVTIKTEVSDSSYSSNDSGNSPDMSRIKRKTPELKGGKIEAKNKHERKPQKRQAKYISDDELSCDSGLVVDLEQSREPDSTVELPRVKRKYTKRKQKEKNNFESNKVEISSSSCTLPVAITDIKVEPNEELADSSIPRPKRKYIKRKLVRKKYKKREPKARQTNQTPVSEISSCKPEPEPTTNSCEDVDIWIELANNSVLSRDIEEFQLFSEEVDNFWDSIEDPNSLFLELEIE